MKRWATAVALVTALLAVPVVLAATGNPKEMVLTLADVQSVPAKSPIGNLADGFVAKLASAAVGKDKEHGRIKSYWVVFENESLPAGYQPPTASYQPPTVRHVFVRSAADVLAARPWRTISGRCCCRRTTSCRRYSRLQAVRTSGTRPGSTDPT